MRMKYLSWRPVGPIIPRRSGEEGIGIAVDVYFIVGALHGRVHERDCVVRGCRGIGRSPDFRIKVRTGAL